MPSSTKADKRAVLTTTRKPAWQPIATAPKDGRHFLAWRDDSDTGFVIYWGKLSSGKGKTGWRNGFCEFLFEDDDMGSFTHWMPLPASPDEEKFGPRVAPTHDYHGNKL